MQLIQYAYRYPNSRKFKYYLYDPSTHTRTIAQSTIPELISKEFYTDDPLFHNTMFSPKRFEAKILATIDSFSDLTNLYPELLI